MQGYRLGKMSHGPDKGRDTQPRKAKTHYCHHVIDKLDKIACMKLEFHKTGMVLLQGEVVILIAHLRAGEMLPSKACQEPSC